VEIETIGGETHRESGVDKGVGCGLLSHSPFSASESGSGTSTDRDAGSSSGSGSGSGTPTDKSATKIKAAASLANLEHMYPIVLLMHQHPHCSVEQQMHWAVRQGAVALLLIQSESSSHPSNQSSTQETGRMRSDIESSRPSSSSSIVMSATEQDPDSLLSLSSIPVGLIGMDVGHRFMAAMRRSEARTIKHVNIQEYKSGAFDYSFVVLFCLACMSVVLSSYLSAQPERQRLMRTIKRSVKRNNRDDEAELGKGAHHASMDEEEEEEEEEDDEDASAMEHHYLDERGAACFIVMASCMLLILFFFMDYLIYIIIGLFCVAAVQSMSHLCTQCLRSIHCFARRRVSIPTMPSITLRSFISITLSFVVAIVWLLNRRNSAAWILQDVMGVSLVLVLPQQLRLPNIKVSVLLLLLAFVYDVFWVFLSPLLFGSSVMVGVARGGSTGEPIPMLLRVPRLNEQHGMMRGEAMLGLGDMALPALLTAYMCRFDYERRRRRAVQRMKCDGESCFAYTPPADANKSYALSPALPSHSCLRCPSFFSSFLYFPLSCIGYGLGLGVTYAALILTQHGQPALLYIVPAMLIATLPIAAYTSDIKHMWKGGKETEENEEEGDADGKVDAKHQYSLLPHDARRRHHSHHHSHPDTHPSSSTSTSSLSYSHVTTTSPTAHTQAPDSYSSIAMRSQRQTQSQPQSQCQPPSRFLSHALTHSHTLSSCGRGTDRDTDIDREKDECDGQEKLLLSHAQEL